MGEFQAEEPLTGGVGGNICRCGTGSHQVAGGIGRAVRRALISGWLQFSVPAQRGDDFVRGLGGVYCDSVCVGVIGHVAHSFVPIKRSALFRVPTACGTVRTLTVGELAIADAVHNRPVLDGEDTDGVASGECGGIPVFRRGTGSRSIAFSRFGYFLETPCRGTDGQRDGIAVAVCHIILITATACKEQGGAKADAGKIFFHEFHYIVLCG